MKSGPILYVEDEENDVFFLKIAFKKIGSPHTLKVLPDGEQAVEYLAGQGEFADRAAHPLPLLVLLDINIPQKNGLEVLAWIRQQREFEKLPVLILTSSSRSEDQARARELGVNDYLIKPSDPNALTDTIKSFHDRWLSE